MKTSQSYLKVLLLTAGMLLAGWGKAQYNTAIGLRAGESSGLTIKHFIGAGALDFIVSFWPNDLAVFCVYERHQQIGSAQGLNFYYGGGGHVAFDTYRRTVYYYDRYNNTWWYRDRGGFGVGLDVILGIEYKFPEVPLALSLDIKPFVEFNTDRNVYGSPDPGLGIKVTF